MRRTWSLGGDGLAGGGDVVEFAFDGHERGAFDGVGVNLLAADHHLALGQAVFLEEGLDGLQVVGGGHVHDGEVFVVEAAVGGGAVVVALDEVVEHALMRFDVALGVHGHEGGELEEAGVDAAEGAGVPVGDGGDDMLLEPGDRVLGGELGDGGGRGAGVDRVRP